MTVPTPDFQNLKLSIGFNILGGASFVDDQHNPGAALQGDGIDNALDLGSPVLQSGDGTAQTVQFWALIPDLTSSTGIQDALGQVTADITSTFRMFILTGGTNHGKLCGQFHSGSNNVVTTGGNTRLDTGLWILITVRVNGNVVDLFYNGIEEASYAPDKNFQFGSGYSGPPLNAADLTVGGALGANFIENGFLMSRIKIWRTVTLSDPEILEEFNNEFAAIGEGFITGETEENRRRGVMFTDGRARL